MARKRARSGRLRDVSLSKLEQKSQALEKSRQQLEHEIERDRVEYGRTLNGSSALLNLPTEVTCMIFYFSATCHVLDNPRNITQSLLPEVVISQVCKRWREVAINYPPLWTRFCFALDKIGSSMVNSLTRFDTYLERSGSRNLELSLDFRAQYRYTRLPIAEQRQLLDMAIKHIHRWQTVTLIMHRHPMCDDDYLTSLLMASAPNLEHFAYLPDYTRTSFRPHEITSLSPSLLQGGASNLQYLLLHGATFKFPSLSNVTTLRIEFKPFGSPTIRYSMETFLEMLSIPSLANLSINGSIFTAHPNDHIPIITMNNLQHLRYGDNKDMTYILPFIRAPLLQTLVIRSVFLTTLSEEYEHGPNTARATADPYFFPSLHTLSVIDFSPRYQSAAWRIMRLSKNIKTMTISHAAVYYPLLSTLQERGPFTDECWPNLTCINIFIDYADGRRFSAIKDFVSSRPKKTITLRLFKQLHSDCQAMYPSDFKAMQEECTVERLNHDAEIALMWPSWPPGVYFPHEEFVNDPFHFETGG